MLRYLIQLAQRMVGAMHDSLASHLQEVGLHHGKWFDLSVAAASMHRNADAKLGADSASDLRCGGTCVIEQLGNSKRLLAVPYTVPQHPLLTLPPSSLV